jgi:hypothetical protein
MGLAFDRADGLMGGGDEAVEGLSRLLNALLGKCSHFGGNVEMISGGHSHLLLWMLLPGMGCDVREVMRPAEELTCQPPIGSGQKRKRGTRASTLALRTATGINRIV